jgi:hypothetical protein
MGDERHDIAAGPDRLDDEPSPAPALASIGPSELRAEMDELREQLEQAFNELFERMDRLEVDPPTLDLAPLDERLADLDGRLRLFAEGLGAHLAGDRARIEASLTGLSQELAAVAGRRVEMDTRALDEAVSRGTLHNASDIANLRLDVEHLIDAVGLQDKGITELRATLEWIKERLLLR